MTQWRLKAYKPGKRWMNPIGPMYDIQTGLSGHLLLPAPKKKDQYKSLDEVDPELLKNFFDKLGISIDEQKKLAGVAGHCRHGLCIRRYNI